MKVRISSLETSQVCYNMTFFLQNYSNINRNHCIITFKLFFATRCHNIWSLPANWHAREHATKEHTPASSLYKFYKFALFFCSSLSVSFLSVCLVKSTDEREMHVYSKQECTQWEMKVEKSPTKRFRQRALSSAIAESKFWSREC